MKAIYSCTAAYSTNSSIKCIKYTACLYAHFNIYTTRYSHTKLHVLAYQTTNKQFVGRQSGASFNKTVSLIFLQVLTVSLLILSRLTQLT